MSVCLSIFLRPRPPGFPSSHSVYIHISILFFLSLSSKSCIPGQIVAAKSSRVGEVFRVLEKGRRGSLLTTSSAQSVRLVVTLSEAGSSLGYNDLKGQFSDSIRGSSGFFAGLGLGMGFGSGSGSDGLRTHLDGETIARK